VLLCDTRYSSQRCYWVMDSYKVLNSERVLLCDRLIQSTQLRECYFVTDSYKELNWSLIVWQILYVYIQWINFMVVNFTIFLIPTHLRGHGWWIFRIYTTKQSQIHLLRKTYSRFRKFTCVETANEANIFTASYFPPIQYIRINHSVSYTELNSVSCMTDLM
jgi:hypothetical protein